MSWSGWRCTRCGHVMADNPRLCPTCGYTVYAPLSGELPACECRACPPAAKGATR